MQALNINVRYKLIRSHTIVFFTLLISSQLPKSCWYAENYDGPKIIFEQKFPNLSFIILYCLNQSMDANLTTKYLIQQIRKNQINISNKNKILLENLKILQQDQKKIEESQKQIEILMLRSKRPWQNFKQALESGFEKLLCSFPFAQQPYPKSKIQERKKKNKLQDEEHHGLLESIPEDSSTCQKTLIASSMSLRIQGDKRKLLPRHEKEN